MTEQAFREEDFFGTMFEMGWNAEQRGETMLGKTKRRAACAFVAATLLAAPVPASACALALVVAMDGSSSVSPEEHTFQLEGLSGALKDDDVRKAIQGLGGIWFSSFEWSGRYQQHVQVDWRFLESDDSISAAAAELAASDRGFTEFPTALGYALGFAAVHMAKVPEPCARRVVDVAGDGINNEGFSADKAYRAFAFDGITVNGLAIAGADPDPVAYYRDKVIRGPGAFVEVAKGFGNYRAAMKRKLLREIRSMNFALAEPASSMGSFHHRR
ncbi:DUF1194 domain-containing protein [Roseibium polysiphoniae]|uniref:DUF1194 domain-containing protein n=1 Tax=Roseibium polysiphoniae TaxID=2571221 RepID=UPI001FEB2419|nr:DUF1194 domain-containing protein [Roseibium polysiphoniae]